MWIWGNGEKENRVVERAGASDESEEVDNVVLIMSWEVKRRKKSRRVDREIEVENDQVLK